MTCTEFFISLAAGVATSLAATNIMTFNQRRSFKKALGKFHEKEFHIFWKTNEPQETPHRIVKCTVSRNVLKYEDVGSSEFTGEIIFNESNLRVGEGYEIHNNDNRFNFPTAIIKDDVTILVYTNYISIQNIKFEAGEIHHQAHVWKMKV